MTIRYGDGFVARLFERIAKHILGELDDVAALDAQLDELAVANAQAVVTYWCRTIHGLGVPDKAFRSSRTYFFSDEPPARTFYTSGTSGGAKGVSHYSPRGLELMRLSILEGARKHLVHDMERPAVLRLVPVERAAPHMVMAHGMDLIAESFGHPELSASVVNSRGLDLDELTRCLDRAVAEGVPVLLIGGSFAFVNACDALSDREWELPLGSRVVDAGGFKGRSREVTVDSLRAMVERVFGVSPSRCTNLFGMTELASQLYDAADARVGPRGERPKGSRGVIEARVRDPRTLELRKRGKGLLEVVDRAVLDRPHVVLTGDWGVASADGVAVSGRVARGESRGCSLTLDAMTAGVA